MGFPSRRYVALVGVVACHVGVVACHVLARPPNQYVLCGCSAVRKKLEEKISHDIRFPNRHLRSPESLRRPALAGANQAPH
jgi:hypothetical protein